MKLSNPQYKIIPLWCIILIMIQCMYIAQTLIIQQTLFTSVNKHHYVTVRVCVSVWHWNVYLELARDILSCSLIQTVIISRVEHNDVWLSGFSE